MRFETAPGRQGQVDFAHFRLPWGKRYALIVVLGYSRLLWVQFYTRQTMKALMHGLESSFSYFGGVPRELLFDQMKAVVIEDGRYDDGALVENPEFMRYAYHWNFRIRLSAVLAVPPELGDGRGRSSLETGPERTGQAFPEAHPWELPELRGLASRRELRRARPTDRPARLAGRVHCGDGRTGAPGRS